MTPTPWDLPAVLRRLAHECELKGCGCVECTANATIARTLADLVQAHNESHAKLETEGGRLNSLRWQQKSLNLSIYAIYGPTPPKEGA